MTIQTDGNQPQAAINMTPMIDVLLVLLIIFMAIAPVKQGGLSTSVPRDSRDQTAVAPENPVVLEIARDGSYRLNSQALTSDALANRLAEIFGPRRERVLFVKGDKSLEYSVVAAAIDTAHGTGIDTVALLPR